MDEAKSGSKQALLWLITVALIAVAAYMYFHR